MVDAPLQLSDEVLIKDINKHAVLFCLTQLRLHV